MRSNYKTSKPDAAASSTPDQDVHPYTLYSTLGDANLPTCSQQIPPPFESNFFKKVFNFEEKEALYATVEAFDDGMMKANLPYFTVFGTLIGSFRHHGEIPWDGDVDVFAKQSDKSSIIRALTGFHPHFKLEKHIEGLYRFQYAKSRPGVIRFERYVDIWLYHENASHIIATSYYLAYRQYKKKTIFPLRMRPFGDLMLPSPCDPLSHFETNRVDVSMCETIYKKYKNLKTAVPCRELHYLFPFVRRAPVYDDGYVEETLVYAGLELHSIRVRSGQGSNWRGVGGGGLNPPPQPSKPTILVKI